MRGYKVSSMGFAVAAALSMFATGALATPADSFTLTGTFTYSVPGISFTSATISGGTGVYSSINNTSVSPDDITFGSEPVNSSFAPTAFLSFPSDPSLADLLVNFIPQGLYTEAGCSAEPVAPGQTCTPSKSPLNFQDTSTNASSLAFSLKGITSDGKDTWEADFSSQFTDNFQNVIDAFGRTGTISNTYSATVTLTPQATTAPAGVPEPMSILFVGAGLAGLGAMHMRRKV